MKGERGVPSTAFCRACLKCPCRKPRRSVIRTMFAVKGGGEWGQPNRCQIAARWLALRWDAITSRYCGQSSSMGADSFLREQCWSCLGSRLGHRTRVQERHSTASIKNGGGVDRCLPGRGPRPDHHLLRRREFWPPCKSDAPGMAYSRRPKPTEPADGTPLIFGEGTRVTPGVTWVSLARRLRGRARPCAFAMRHGGEAVRRLPI